MVRRCAWSWGTCRNDERFPLLWKRNNGDDIFFIRFPSARYEGERRQSWIKACHRGDNFECTKNSYICSSPLHGIEGFIAGLSSCFIYSLSFQNKPKVVK